MWEGVFRDGVPRPQLSRSSWFALRIWLRRWYDAHVAFWDRYPPDRFWPPHP